MSTVSMCPPPAVEAAAAAAGTGAAAAAAAAAAPPGAGGADVIAREAPARMAVATRACVTSVAPAASASASRLSMYLPRGGVGCGRAGADLWV
eukprot:360252-Chlamydomonas_euryale.AAC.1